MQRVYSSVIHCKANINEKLKYSFAASRQILLMLCEVGLYVCICMTTHDFENVSILLKVRQRKRCLKLGYPVTRQLISTRFENHWFYLHTQQIQSCAKRSVCMCSGSRAKHLTILLTECTQNTSQMYGVFHKRIRHVLKLCVPCIFIDSTFIQPTNAQHLMLTASSFLLHSYMFQCISIIINESLCILQILRL